MKDRVHQGSMLSPFLFLIVTDALTNDVIKTIKEFLHGDDLVLVGEDRKKVEEKYVNWKKVSESNELNWDVMRLRLVNSFVRSNTC